MLQAAMWPQLTEQDLHTVREIEDADHPGRRRDGAQRRAARRRDCSTAGSAPAPATWTTCARHQEGTGIEFEKFTNRNTTLRLFRGLKIDPPLDPESPPRRRRAQLLVRGRAC
jgi:hypothetical protein